MNQKVWFAIAIIVFIICTGGIVFTILNQMPLFRYERNSFGQIVIAEYFMRGQRGQYGGEGYIASSLITAIGLVYLYMARVPKFVSGDNAIRIRTLVSLGLLLVLQKGLLYIYRLKSSWYDPGFWPPDYYTRGSLASDQGNNI